MAEDKPEKKKKKSSKKWQIYEVGDTLNRKRKSCPKCGPGVYMAKHPNRVSCGSCGYTEFEKGRVKEGEASEGKEAAPKEDTPAKEEKKEAPKAAEQPEAKEKKEPAEKEAK